MRPRLFTAEDSRALFGAFSSLSCFNEAAAIHRGRHRETWHLSLRSHCFNEAAAIHRGRHQLLPISEPQRIGFNEAAAIHRGRLVRTAILARENAASMRPRLFTAEDRSGAGRRHEVPRRFNEAAAIHRGRRNASGIGRQEELTLQ